MHATVHPFRCSAVAGSDPQGILHTVLGGADPAGTVVIEHQDGDEGTVVALWPDEAQVRTGTRSYRVVDRLDGVDAGRSPLFAQLVWVNGTGDPAVARAAERGGRERIHPAIGDVDGLVGVLVLRSADDRIVVVGLATGLETHLEVRDRIAHTPLLPGEDPALLPGPDRMALGRVLRADLPAEVRS